MVIVCCPRWNLAHRHMVALIVLFTLLVTLQHASLELL